MTFHRENEGLEGTPIMMKLNCQCWKTGVNMGILHDLFWLKKLKTTRNELFWFRQGMIFRFQPRVDYISKEWYPHHLSRDPSWFPIVFEVNGDQQASFRLMGRILGSTIFCALIISLNTIVGTIFFAHHFIFTHSFKWIPSISSKWRWTYGSKGFWRPVFSIKSFFLRNKCVERCLTTITGKEDNPLHISTGSPDFFRLDCWASQLCLYFRIFGSANFSDKFCLW